MDAAPIDSAAMTQARRLMGVALVVAPAATQVAWLISNHFARWPLRLGLPLVGGVLLAWALCRLHRAACRHWADDARAQRRLFALAAGTWPLLLFLPAPLLRLVYPDGLIPYLAFGVLASMWSVNAVTALLPEGLIPRLVRAGTLTVLAVGLGWHLLGLATGTGRFDPARENRNPAPPPEWPTTVAEVQAWPRAFERYFDDQFRGRMHLVSFASSVDLLVLNRNFNPLSVVRGEQGWLYRNSGERQLEYAYRWTFPPELIDGFERNLADRVAWLRANDQKYLLVLTPDKRSVHPEFIPQFPLEPGRPGKLDQIVPRFDRMGLTSTCVHRCATAQRKPRGHCFINTMCTGTCAVPGLPISTSPRLCVSASPCARQPIWRTTPGPGPRRSGPAATSHVSWAIPTCSAKRCLWWRPPPAGARAWCSAAAVPARAASRCARIPTWTTSRPGKWTIPRCPRR
jgi:hypothetical protein